MVQPFLYQGALTPLVQHYNYGQGRHGDGIYMASHFATFNMSDAYLFKEHGSYSRKKID
jgi:hypothetical protein